MARRVRIHPDFLADVTRQIAWLARNGETSWIGRLEADVSGTMELLDRYPAAGMLIERQGAIVLRQVIFRSTPYVAWYLYDDGPPTPDVLLVRLYHARQRRPRPDPSRWLRGSSEGP